MATIWKRLAMSVAAMRTRLDIELVGELRAAFAALNSVSVTVFRQSTQVPNTSKKRALGSVIGDIVALVEMKMFWAMPL